MASPAPDLNAAVEKARAVSASVQEKLQDTRRTLKQLRQDAYDKYDDTIFQVKRHPAKALAITAGAGACLGVGIGLAIGRLVFRRKRSFLKR
jgi:ElaB/YqjD/DUF883 family membrane-anchored ribosome-binding protein